MATPAEPQGLSMESEVTLANVASTDLICQLCTFLTVQIVPNQSDGSRVCEDCLQKNSLPKATAIIVDSICEKREQPKTKTVENENEMPVDRGVKRELNTMTEISCPGRSWNGFEHEYEEHMRQNHGSFQCFDCCASFSTINSYQTHRQDICEYPCVPCPLPGCNKMVKLCEMETHYLSEKHQQILAEFAIHCANMCKQGSDRFNHSKSTSSNTEGAMQKVPTVEENTNALSLELINRFNGSTQLAVKCTDMGTMDQSIILSSNIPPLLKNDDSIIFPFHLANPNINSPFSFDSPSFRTSSFGYVFTLRVCSTAPSNHLSIYLTLHRSPYDAVLTYPFPYSMTLYLCDQSGQGDIKSTIRADPASPAFARPSGEKNPEVGVMNFCSLNYLTKTGSNYLKDDVFFIRVLFHFMSIPTK